MEPKSFFSGYSPVLVVQTMKKTMFATSMNKRKKMMETVAGID